MICQTESGLLQTVSAESSLSSIASCFTLPWSAYVRLLVVNTPSGKLSAIDDSYIRKAAIKYKVPYITTTAAAVAAARGIGAQREHKSEVRSLQQYHSDIK
jgi:hypothetical protein